MSGPLQSLTSAADLNAAESAQRAQRGQANNLPTRRVPTSDLPSSPMRRVERCLAESPPAGQRIRCLMQSYATQACERGLSPPSGVRARVNRAEGMPSARQCQGIHLSGWGDPQADTL